MEAYEQQKKDKADDGKAPREMTIRAWLGGKKPAKVRRSDSDSDSDSGGGSDNSGWGEDPVAVLEAARQLNEIEASDTGGQAGNMSSHKRATGSDRPQDGDNTKRANAITIFTPQSLSPIGRRALSSHAGEY